MVDSILKLVTRYGIWVVLLGVLSVYLLSLTPHIGPFDSAWYLVLAKSIATGQGYRNLQQVGMPPHTHFPFGFPLLLSPVWMLFSNFPENAYAFKLVPLLFGIATWWIFYIFLRRHSDLGMPLILAVVLLSALTPLMVFFAAQELMSETSYMFFSFLSLLLFGRVADGKGSRRLTFGLAVAALAMSYFVRTVGVSLLIAVVLYFALKRAWKRAVLTVALLGLLISPWIVRNLWVGVSPLSGDYGQDMWLKDYARPELGSIIGYGELIPRALHNAHAHATDSILWIFLPQLALDRPVSLPAFLYQGWVKASIGFAITCLIACGMTAEWQRRKEIPLPVLYILIYMGPVLLQPWVGARNLISIMPLLFYYFFGGLRASVNLGRPVFRQIIPQMPCAVAWVTALIILVSLARSDSHRIRTAADYRSGANPDAAVESFVKASQWIEANVPASRRFFSSLPNWLYLYTGQVTLPIPDELIRSEPGLETVDEFLASLQLHEADYVVLQPQRPSYDGKVDGEAYDHGESVVYSHTVSIFPEYFLLRFETDMAPETLIYEFLEPRLP